MKVGQLLRSRGGKFGRKRKYTEQQASTVLEMRQCGDVIELLISQWVCLLVLFAGSLH